LAASYADIGADLARLFEKVGKLAFPSIKIFSDTDISAANAIA